MPTTFISPFAQALREYAKKPWEDCYRHPFVQELGAGTLRPEAFCFYLRQDYVYLLEYAKVFACGAAKARTERAMANFTATQYAILRTEMELHRGYMKSFGISPAEAAATAPSLFNKAYTSNMLAVAQAGDAADILAVILPCAWSYHDYALRLTADCAGTIENNFFRSWIDSYASEEYRASISWLFEEIETESRGKNASERERLAEIFHTSMEFEYLFWEMSYKEQTSY